MKDNVGPRKETVPAIESLDFPMEEAKLQYVVLKALKHINDGVTQNWAILERLVDQSSTAAKQHAPESCPSATTPRRSE